MATEIIWVVPLASQKIDESAPIVHICVREEDYFSEKFLILNLDKGIHSAKVYEYKRVFSYFVILIQFENLDNFNVANYIK